MIRLALGVMFRPVETFQDLQWQGLGRIPHAVALVLLTYLASLLSILVTAFPFQTAENELSTIAIQAVRVIIPWVLWVVANYAVSTIAFGEGRFRDIFVGCAYALAPYLFLSVPVALLTSVLTLSEKVVIDFLESGIRLWCVLLFFLQIQVQHNFEGMRAAGIAMVMLFTAAVIAAGAILAYVLTDQFVRFLIQLFLEVTIRG
jgi:hypothetical protein